MRPPGGQFGGGDAIDVAGHHSASSSLAAINPVPGTPVSAGWDSPTVSDPNRRASGAPFVADLARRRVRTADFRSKVAAPLEFPQFSALRAIIPFIARNGIICLSVAAAGGDSASGSSYAANENRAKCCPVDEESKERPFQKTCCRTAFKGKQLRNS